MRNIRGMVSDDTDVPWGVTDMRKQARFYLFRRKPIVQKDRYETWMEVAKFLGFKTQERLRVEWMVLHYTIGKKNAILTTQHFGISRKTFHK